MRDDAPQGARDIVLLGHIDTFPGYITPRIEDDKLYGRGAVDAKGCLAAFVAACARVGAQEGVRFVVIGAVEEECATSKGARYALTQYAPYCCIIGEPSGWDRITLGYKGRLLASLEARQPAGHTAGPLASVCEAAVTWWLGVNRFTEEFNQGREAAFDRILPSLRAINTASDGLHDQVEATIALRLPLDVERAHLEQALEGAVPKAPDLETRITFWGYEPAYRAAKNTPLARAFIAAIRTQGGQPGFKVKTGTSDMNVVGPAWECPIVAYGPGDSSLDHTPHEHLLLDEYWRAVLVLEQTLRTLGQVVSRT